MSETEPPSTHILLVRHGQALQNREGVNAPPDSGLTEVGWQQALRVADWLERRFAIDALASSSLLRARQTAYVIGQQLGLPVEVLPGLDEAQQPYWNEFPAVPDDPLAWWDRPWQADATHAPLYTQFRQVLRRALAELLDKHLGQTVVVVTHGGPIGTIMRSLFGGHQMPVFTENGGVTHLVWQEGRWRLVSHNERAHLEEGIPPAMLPWSEPGPTQTIIEHFRRLAPMTPLTPPAASAEQLRALVALVKPRHDDLVLDIGTGAGAAALAFAPHVRQVTAVDISPAMLERAELARIAQGAANVELRWADACALPCPDAAYDLAICRDLCGYIADLDAFWMQLRRILRPDGRLALDETIGSEDPVKRATHQALEAQRDPALIRLYSRSEIEERLQTAGFQIIQAETYESSLDLETWLATSTLEGTERDTLREMLRSSIENNAAGLQIQHGKRGAVTFTVRRLRLLARSAPS